MSKNVAVFVDVANIFYAAKAAGVDIDYVTLLKSATAGRDFVRAYAYTGLDPENDNQRNFHDFLKRSGYKVVSKDIRKYGDGKVKANLDIELVVDMMRLPGTSTSRSWCPATATSRRPSEPSSRWASAARSSRSAGTPAPTSIEVADLFTDITHLARVEKGARCGRRVAGRRRRPVHDRGARQADRGHRRGPRPRPWPGPWPSRRGRAGRASARPRPGSQPARVRRRRPLAPSSPCRASGSRRPGPSARRISPPPRSSRSTTSRRPRDDGLETGGADLDGETGADAPRRRRRRGGRGRGRGRGRADGVDGDRDDRCTGDGAGRRTASMRGPFEADEDEIDEPAAAQRSRARRRSDPSGTPSSARRRLARRAGCRPSAMTRTSTSRRSPST